MNFKHFFLFDTYKKIKNNLPDYVLKSILKLMPIYFISSIFEIIGLVTLFPVVKVVVEPSYINANKYINFLYKTFKMRDFSISRKIDKNNKLL